MELHRRGHRSRLRVALLASTALVGALVGAGPVHSQTSDWTGATDNDYGTPGNWSGGVPPPDSNTKSAHFSTGGANTSIDVAAPVTVQNWLFTGTTSYAIAGAAVTFDGSSAGLINDSTVDQSVANDLGGAGATVTQSGSATLTLTGFNDYGGATNVTSGTLLADSDTALPITTNVTVNTGATLKIGEGVFADINSLADGTSGGGSVVIGTVDPSTTLFIGFNGGATTSFSGSITGVGSLSLDGGSLTLTGASNIGGDLTICNCATLTLSGPSASFNATGDPFGFVQGTDVSGTLNVLNGASFTTNNLIISNAMTVSGAGSNATATGLTFVGAGGGAASLTISDGAQVNSQGGAVIENPAAVPTVTVTGPGSRWIVGTSFYVGGLFAGGPGNLMIAAGGVVDSTGPMSIGADPAFGLGPSSVTVTGLGSVLNANTSLVVGYNCICADYAGTLTAADGGRVNASGGIQIGLLGTVNIGTGGLAGSIDTPTIVNDGQIVANFTDTSTLAADISGTGSLTKLGPGVLKLTGNNTYLGATTLSGGKLSVSQEANLGALASMLNFDGGILQVTGTSFNSTARTINWGASGGGFDVADAANTFTVNHVLGGPGGLTKDGPGTLVLGGANTYAGVTTIADGTLSISADNNIGTGSVAMLNGTTLQFTSSFTFNHNITVAGDPTFNVGAGLTTTIAGTIADGATPGDVVKAGPGTLVLGSNNTYSGGTIISAGILRPLNGLALGSGAVTLNGGTLQAGATFQLTNPFKINTPGGTIDTNGNTFWLSNTISDGNGAGALTKVGAGILLLTANNTYTGGTTITQGRLEIGDGGTTGSIVGNVTNNAVLSFNRSNSLTFDGIISGTGTVAHNGTGITTLTGISTYTGSTNVNFGTLLVNGSIASSIGVNVAAGATLGGTGTVGPTTVTGNLSPGNSIGTITINGNLTFAGAGNYIVEVSPTAADRTNVTGTASLAGTLTLQPTGGTYTPGKKYTLLNTTAGLSGTFSTGDITALFGKTIRASLTYDANNVILNLDPTPISSLIAAAEIGSPVAANVGSVAAAIDAGFKAGKLPEVFLSVLSLPETQIAPALNLLGGEVHASAAGVLLDESLYVRSAVLGRLRQASYGGESSMAALSLGGPQTSYQDEALAALAYDKSRLPMKAPMKAPQATSDIVFWAQGFGARGRFDTDGNAATVRRDLAGFFTGVDMRVGASGRAGIAAGYTGSRNNLDGRGSANVETGHVAAYGGWSFGNINLRAGGAYAFHSIDTDRTIVFTGFADRLTARYDGSTGQVFGEIGYGFAFGNVAVEPFAGGAWVRIDTEAAREQGGAAALNFAGTSLEVGYSTLGIRAASLIPVANSMVLVPRATVAWQHAFDNVTPAAALAFQNTGVSFLIAGVPIARDSLLAEAGLDLAIGPNVTLGVSYTGQIARNVADHAAKGKFSWGF